MKLSLGKACLTMLTVGMCLVCISCAAATTQSSATPGLPPITCTAHSTAPITLNMYYGSEKQAWIDAVVPAFNQSHATACDGAITVQATPIGSGDSMNQILAGKIQPDIWSPAGRVWLPLINTQWRATHSGDFVDASAQASPSILTSPVVIAMWKNEAEAMGWPDKAIGWTDIAALSANPQGWAAYNHPEWGAFKFGHTLPDSSNSGLDAVIAENYAAVGKTSGLTATDATNAATQAIVTNIESSVVHYGDSTGFFADEMFKKGPGYLSAAVLYENLVVESYDKSVYPDVGTTFPQVVAIYPREGTFYSDHPFAIPQAPWVTPAKKAAAQVFLRFLLQQAQQQQALRAGFRPAGMTGALLSAPIDQSHGVDPHQPAATLQVPPAEVVMQMQRVWEMLKRKVDVMLILDRSGSMNDADNGITKLTAAKQGMTQFTELLSADDSLGLTVFSTATQVLSPVTPLGPKHDAFVSQIQSITASGNTRLFDSIIEQTAALQALPAKHIKAVVVLTDGQDNVSHATASAVVNAVMAQGADAGNGVKIFTIAYGSDANVTDLTNIATASGGVEYSGTPANIAQIYAAISRFF